jgi:hypothetical protein
LVVFSKLFLALVLFFLFFSLGNICSLLIFYFNCEDGCENWFC